MKQDYRNNIGAASPRTTYFVSMHAISEPSWQAREQEIGRGPRGWGIFNPDLSRQRRCPCAWWSAGRRRGEWNPKCPLPPAHQPDPHAIRLFFRRRCSRTAVPGPGRRRWLLGARVLWELVYSWAEEMQAGRWRVCDGSVGQEMGMGICGCFLPVPGFFYLLFIWHIILYFTYHNPFLLRPIV